MYWNMSSGAKCTGFAQDDECLAGDASCALNALQLRGEPEDMTVADLDHVDPEAQWPGQGEWMGGMAGLDGFMSEVWKWLSGAAPKLLGKRTKSSYFPPRSLDLKSL